MTSHHGYHLILSASERECTPEDAKKHHLSLRASGTNRRRGEPESVWQIPKWSYKRKSGSDQVTLDVPGAVMENVSLYISRRDLNVSALACENITKHKIDCEYYFRMRLADDNDEDNISFSCSNGLLTILVPRITLKVRKVVPAFVLNRKRDVDEVRLEMAGVKHQDVRCKVKAGSMSIRGVRYELIDKIKTASIEFIFHIKISNTQVNHAPWTLENGILTAYIPRIERNTKKTIRARNNVRRHGKEILELELPGVKEKDIEIHAMGNKVRVEAHRFENDDDEQAGKIPYIFTKEFSQTVAQETIESELKDGILVLSIPQFLAEMS